MVERVGGRNLMAFLYSNVPIIYIFYTWRAAVRSSCRLASIPPTEEDGAVHNSSVWANSCNVIINCKFLGHTIWIIYANERTNFFCSPNWTESRRRAHGFPRHNCKSASPWIEEDGLGCCKLGIALPDTPLRLLLLRNSTEEKDAWSLKKRRENEQIWTSIQSNYTKMN